MSEREVIKELLNFKLEADETLREHIGRIRTFLKETVGLQNEDNEVFYRVAQVIIFHTAALNGSLDWVLYDDR